MKVQNMTSKRSGREVANQFIIYADDATYFQSYNSIIAKVDKATGRVTLDRNTWDYSRTTAKYRNDFLVETAKETQRKVRDGIYLLVNLNT